jgi:hypothetical protein
MNFDPSEFGIPTQEWGPNVLTLGYVEARERRQLAVGVDPAALVDYCGVCLMESIEEPEFDAAGQPVLDINQHQRLVAPRFEIRSLKRLPRGISHLQIIAEVSRLITHPEVAGAQIVVDRTGLGPIFDFCVSAGFKNLIGVKITSSVERETREPDGSGFRVGKLQLVNNLRTCLETGRLKLPRDLPESKTFLEELRAFAMTVSDRGYASFNSAGSGAHDDLISASFLSLFALLPRKMGDWTVEQF